MQLTNQEITKIINEEPRALLNFLRQLSPILKRFFYSRIDNAQDQEELVQDTILSIIDSLPQFQNKSKFSTWAISIARHELIDYYRRKKIKAILFSRFPFLEQIVSKALGPQLALEEKETKDKIYQTFKKLSEGQADILRLRYLEGLSVSAIARQLDITYKAAESRLFRARLAFSKSFVQS